MSSDGKKPFLHDLPPDWPGFAKTDGAWAEPKPPEKANVPPNLLPTLDLDTGRRLADPLKITEPANEAGAKQTLYELGFRDGDILENKFAGEAGGNKRRIVAIEQKNERWGVRLAAASETPETTPEEDMFETLSGLAIKYRPVPDAKK